MKTFRQLHKTDPYDGFPPLPPNIKGFWMDDEHFDLLIREYKPKRIIEVGSWLGASAIHMARLTRELNTEILCIDTWLGSAEWYYNLEDESRYGSLDLKQGYPQVYYQFRSNVMHEGFQDRITPLPLSSLAAARVLQYHRLTADLVYIDAGHYYEEVLADIRAFYPLATKAIFGDDWDFNPWKDDVQGAVKDFCNQNHLTYSVSASGRQWVIRKAN